MNINEAIDLCAKGNLFIAVRSWEEKQKLIDLLQDCGYETGCAVSETYYVYPYCALKGGQNIDERVCFTFWPEGSRRARADRLTIEFHDLLLEDTPITLDVNSVSDLL